MRKKRIYTLVVLFIHSNAHSTQIEYEKLADLDMSGAILILKFLVLLTILISQEYVGDAGLDDSV